MGLSSLLGMTDVDKVNGGGINFFPKNGNDSHGLTQKQ